MRLPALAAVFAASFGLPAFADTKLLRFPDVSATQVAFVYAGDIFVAPRGGGTAKRLTTHAGQELFPKFSPDGSQIAFSAEYSGSRQVFIMPSDGSAAPKQLTWYNDIGPMPPRGGYDYRILDFTPDAQHVLVRMNRLGFDERAGQPYLVPVAGGDEMPLPIPETGGGMLSPDGKKYVYTPIDREFRTWKRTRGGRAQDVWIYDLEKNQSAQLTNHRGTDNQPTWIGDSIYFTSDRNYTLNLFALPSNASAETAPKQITQFDEFDVLWPSAGADAIVFENGGSLYLMEQAALEQGGAPKRLVITVQGDAARTLPTIKSVKRQVESVDLSPNGERALLSARGELFSVPKANGEIRQLTQTADAREMSAVISPDAKHLAYLSDASGEYELYVRALADGQVRQLTKANRSWYLSPIWAPNSDSLLLSNSENELWLVTMAGESTRVDDATYGNGIRNYRFAPDNGSVVYVKDNAAGLSEIWHFARASGRRQLLIGGQFDASEPTFDAQGKYLFFASNRDHRLQFSSYEFNYLYVDASRLFAARLNPAAGALTAPKSEEFGAAKAASAEPSKAGSASPVIDFSGLSERVEALPIPGGSLRGLEGADNALLYVQSGTNQSASLHRFDLTTLKSERVADKVDDYRVNAPGTHILLRSGEQWIVAEAKKDADVSKPLDLTRLELRIEPKREWAQLYRDALRVLRTWFYDEGMHGQDWTAIERRYATLLPHVSDRADLDYILGEVAGELNAGHVYVNKGDEVSVERKNSGLLGAEFKRLSNGHYQVQKIFPGQNWSEEFRSPLLDQGVDVRVGDVITAINAVPTASVKNFYQLLENQAARLVELSVLRDGKTRIERVKTIAAETNLRYLDWVQTRAEMVERLSGGRIGYVHLPNTAVEGNRELFKQFPSQIKKQALIIDDRYNGGGFIPDRMIEIIARKPLNYWKRRGLEPTATPLLSHDGPKAMLINGLSSSGGDALPYYFRKLKLGVIIGTRTWGGLIGISGNPGMADGGSVNAATFRLLDTEGRWAVENEGVAPDIEVIDRPELLIAGQDPSLERAVAELLKTLQANPPKPVQVPPAPSEFGRD